MVEKEAKMEPNNDEQNLLNRALKNSVLEVAEICGPLSPLLLNNISQRLRDTKQMSQTVLEICSIPESWETSHPDLMSVKNSAVNSQDLHSHSSSELKKLKLCQKSCKRPLFNYSR